MSETSHSSDNTAGNSPSLQTTVINIQTDVTVSPEMLTKCNWQTLRRIATEGTVAQQDCLIDWGYASIPAWMFEELFFLAKGEEWQQDD